MAAGRLRLLYRMLGVAMVIVAAGATYRLKHAVRGLDADLAGLRQETEAERWALRAAHADLEYLIRPERLVLQARQLGLVPARGARIVAVDAIPSMAQLRMIRSPLPVVLPSGGEAVLLARPVAMPLLQESRP